MIEYLFIGEKPSATAFLKGWTWTDGRLAARQLFDALEASGINPRQVTFSNLFGETPDAPEVSSWAMSMRLGNIRRHKGTVVAMGKKVARHLTKAGIPHRAIVHPAARGKIRAKAVYAAHVREVLA